MKRRYRLSFLLSLTALAPALGCGGSAQPARASSPNPPDPVSTTVFGERALLFVEFPRLVAGRPARFLAHFTVLDTGEPVRSGAVTLEVGAAKVRVEAPKRDGLFTPEWSPPVAGTFPARFVVESEQVRETLELGEVTVHASEQAALEHAPAEGEDPPSAVPFLLEQQWRVKLLVARAQPRTLSRRLIVPARAEAPEGAAVIVSSTVGGRLVGPPSGGFPRTGERVEAGRTLALVEPPLGASDLGQLRALDLELDLRALDVVRASGEAGARLRYAETERERIARLRAEGLSTQRELDRAEQELALAKNESEAAARMQGTLDSLLASRRSKPEGAFAVVQPVPLSSPIAGIVVEVGRVEGESVGAGETIFRVVDPARIRVEGRVSELDLPLVREARGAVATFPALPDRRFELVGASGGRAYVGQEVDASSRTLSVRYELDNGEGEVRIGMLAELEIETARVEAAVAIPVEAVVSDQGLPTAYVMLGGELFQKRELELGIRDGDFVEVRQGLAPGERVATRGAYVVKLAALSPTAFGAGHAH